MSQLFYPEASYSLHIQFDEFNERYILRFRSIPEDLVIDLLTAVGFKPIENGLKFYLKDEKNVRTEKLMAWTQELKDCLAVKCFPKEIPYSPENPPSEANVRAGFYSIITVAHKNSSGRRILTKFLSFDYTSKKRKGFANLFGRVNYGDRFIEATAERGDFVKIALSLLNNTKTIVAIPSPFGDGCPPLNRKDQFNPLDEKTSIPIVDEYNKQDDLTENNSSDISKTDEVNSGDESSVNTPSFNELLKDENFKNQLQLFIENMDKSDGQNTSENIEKPAEENTKEQHTENVKDSTKNVDKDSPSQNKEDSIQKNTKEDEINNPANSIETNVVEENPLKKTDSDSLLRNSKDSSIENMEESSSQNIAEQDTEYVTDSDMNPANLKETDSPSKANEDSNDDSNAKSDTKINIESVSDSDPEKHKEMEDQRGSKSTAKSEVEMDITIPKNLANDLNELLGKNNQPTNEKFKIDPRRKRKKGAKPKLKASSVIQHPYTKIFMKLHQLVPNLEELLKKGNLYMKSTFKDESRDSAFMDFSLELLHTDIDELLYTISMSHFYEMNGDLVPDPDMSVEIDFVTQTAQAKHFRDQRSYTEINENTSHQSKRSINDFLLLWINNLIKQGHILDEHTIINSGYEDETEFDDLEEIGTKEVSQEVQEKNEDSSPSKAKKKVAKSKKVTFLPDKVQLKLAVLSFNQNGTEEKIRCTSWEEVDNFEKEYDLKSWKDGKVAYEIFWEDNTTFQEVIRLKANQSKENILGKFIFTEIVLCIQSLENRLKDFQCFTEASIDDFKRYLVQLDFGFNTENHEKGLVPKVPLKLFSVNVTKGKYHHKNKNNSEIKNQLQQLQWVGSLVGENSKGVKAQITFSWADGKTISISKSPMEIPKEVSMMIIYQLVNEADEKLVITHQTHENQAILFPTEYKLQGRPLYYQSIIAAYYKKGIEVDPSDLIVWENAVIILPRLKALLPTIFRRMSVIEKLSVFQKIIDRYNSSNKKTKAELKTNANIDYSTPIQELLLGEVNLEADTEEFNRKCELSLAQVMESYEQSHHFKNENFGFLIDILCDGELTMIDLPTEPERKKQPSILNEKERLEKNKAIEELLDRKGERGSYTEEEKNLLSQYSGYGGLKSAGVQKGRLHEYFTPATLVEIMWELAEFYGYKGGAVLEPSIGTGNFLLNASRAERMVGFEVNQYSAMICKVLIPDVDIIVDHFESIFFRGNKHLKNDFIMKPFDLVIGNPPYGEFNSFYAGLGERKFTKATQYDQYFITRGLDLLKSGGLLVMLISSYFHRADSGYDKVKELIASKAVLLRKITLPNKALPYTEVGTDIVIYKKR